MKRSKLAFYLKSFLIVSMAACAGFIVYNNTVKDAAGSGADKNLAPMKTQYQQGKYLDETQNFQRSLGTIHEVMSFLDDISGSQEMPQGAVPMEGIGGNGLYLVTIPVASDKFIMLALSFTKDQPSGISDVFTEQKELSERFNMFVAIPPLKAITSAAESIKNEIGTDGRRDAGQSKSSSAGIVEQVKRLREDIITADQGLFDMMLSLANVMEDSTIKEYMRKLGDFQKLLDEAASKSPEAMVELHKDIENVAVSLETMGKVYDASAAAQNTDIRDVKGTIVINEDEIPQNQQAVLTAMFDKASPYLQALEVKLGCTIRLLSQYAPATDSNDNMIAISSQSVDGITKNIDIRSVAPDGYLPLEQIIILAKGLLAYNPETAVSLGSAIGQMYNYITKSTLPQDVLDVFLQTSRFVLDLPALIAIDPAYYEHLHKQALSALISA